MTEQAATGMRGMTATGLLKRGGAKLAARARALAGCRRGAAVVELGLLLPALLGVALLAADSLRLMHAWSEMAREADRLVADPSAWRGDGLRAAAAGGAVLSSERVEAGRDIGLFEAGGAAGTVTVDLVRDNGCGPANSGCSAAAPLYVHVRMTGRLNGYSPWFDGMNAPELQVSRWARVQ